MAIHFHRNAISSKTIHQHRNTLATERRAPPKQRSHRWCLCGSAGSMQLPPGKAPCLRFLPSPPAQSQEKARTNVFISSDVRESVPVNSGLESFRTKLYSMDCCRGQMVNCNHATVQPSPRPHANATMCLPAVNKAQQASSARSISSPLCLRGNTSL
jgi:hypothetical protein